jgi:cytoskeletal protein RodZ
MDLTDTDKIIKLFYENSSTEFKIIVVLILFIAYLLAVIDSYQIKEDNEEEDNEEEDNEEEDNEEEDNEEEDNEEEDNEEEDNDSFNRMIIRKLAAKIEREKYETLKTRP